MVASIAKPLQDKSTKSRQVLLFTIIYFCSVLYWRGPFLHVGISLIPSQAALALLREYVTVCPGGLAGTTATLLPLVSKCIRFGSSWQLCRLVALMCASFACSACRFQCQVQC
jgi:hypothetical protein